MIFQSGHKGKHIRPACQSGTEAGADLYSFRSRTKNIHIIFFRQKIMDTDLQNPENACLRIALQFHHRNETTRDTEIYNSIKIKGNDEIKNTMPCRKNLVSRSLSFLPDMSGPLLLPDAPRKCIAETGQKLTSLFLFIIFQFPLSLHR